MHKIGFGSIILGSIFGTILVVFMFSPLPFLSTDNQQASAFSFLTPFGGKVTSVLICTCVNNGDAVRQKKLVYVSSPRGGTFIKDLTTRVYRNNAVSMGNWVVGLAGTTEQCWEQVGKACQEIGQGKLMRMVGTSGVGFGF
jgi:hypothetical protein